MTTSWLRRWKWKTKPAPVAQEPVGSPVTLGGNIPTSNQPAFVVLLYKFLLFVHVSCACFFSSYVLLRVTGLVNLMKNEEHIASLRCLSPTASFSVFRMCRERPHNLGEILQSPSHIQYSKEHLSTKCLIKSWNHHCLPWKRSSSSTTWLHMSNVQKPYEIPLYILIGSYALIKWVV